MRFVRFCCNEFSGSGIIWPDRLRIETGKKSMPLINLQGLERGSLALKEKEKTGFCSCWDQRWVFCG